MRKRQPEFIAKGIIFLIVLLVTAAGIPGIFFAETYARETSNAQAQSIGQDIFDLACVLPVLLAALFFDKGKPGIFFFLRGSMLLFLFYTFMIYCFSLHFNRYFLLYCGILFFILFALILFLKRFFLLFREVHLSPDIHVKGAAVFFMLISLLFAALWLSEIIPAIIRNAIPASVTETGTPVNPVHVLDLTLFLPGTFITGWYLWKRDRIAVCFSPVLLLFLTSMCLNIGILVIVMKRRSIPADVSVAWIMAGLAGICLYLLLSFLRNFRIGKTGLDT